MQIETFKVFRDLAELASFSRAAEANGITQSAVSQQVLAIEKKLNLRLIERGKGSFELTAEGRAFLKASRAILEAYDSFSAEIHADLVRKEGELRISTIYSIGLHELPPCLRAFRTEHPAIAIRVDYRRNNEVYDSVLSGAADLGLVAYPSKRQGLKALTFWRDKLVLICTPEHRLARKRLPRLRDLAEEKFVAFEPDQPTRREIDKRLRQQKLRIRPVFEFDNIETVKRAVEIEDAVSIVPESAVRHEVHSGTLVAISLDEPEMWRPLGALVKSRSPRSPALKEFLAMLEKTELGRL